MGIFDIFAKLGGAAPKPDPAMARPVADTSGDAGFTAAAPAPTTPAIAPADADAASSQPHGIAALLSHVGHFLNDQDPARGSSFADRAGLFGAQLQDISEGSDRAGTMQKRFDDRVATSTVDARQKQLADMADQLHMTPRERFMFLTSPKEWATAYAPHLVGGDGSYGTQTTEGVTPTGTLPMSPHQQAMADATDARIAALENWRQEQLPILKQRANAATTSAAASAERAHKAKNGAADPATGFNPGTWTRKR